MWGNLSEAILLGKLVQRAAMTRNRKPKSLSNDNIQKHRHSKVIDSGSILLGNASYRF